MSIWNLGGLLGGGSKTPANQQPDYWRQKIASQADVYGRQAQGYQSQSDAADRAWKSGIDNYRNYYDQPGLNQMEQSALGHQQAANAWDAEQARSNAATAFGRSGDAAGSDYQGAVQGTTNAQLLANAMAQRDAYNQAAARYQQGAQNLPALYSQWAQAQQDRLTGAQNAQSLLTQQILASYLQQQQQRQQQRGSDLGLIGSLAGGLGQIFSGKGKF